MGPLMNASVRAAKPRRVGITHVLDKLMPPGLLGQYLAQNAGWVDIVKLGWGLSQLDPAPGDRSALCRSHGVVLCTGGTLLEIAAMQNRVSGFRRWAQRHGVDAVEVSNGLGLLTRSAKHRLVAELSQDFVVIAETGAKDPAVAVDGALWAEEMKDDLDAGATWVVAEGRESGTVGLYDPDGHVREEMFAQIVSVIEADRIIFEAPRKSQQVWLIQQLGPDANLGNLDLAEVPGVESLRLGLRADTAVGRCGVER